MITDSAQKMKQTLFHIISDMEKYPNLFVHHPDIGFTRARKLSFSHMIRFLSSMVGNNVCKELLDYFDFHPDSVSASAFSQRRAKLLPETLSFLFHSFTETFQNLQTYWGLSAAYL